MFCAQRMLMCLLCGSLCTTHLLIVIMEMKCVYYAARTDILRSTD